MLPCHVSVHIQPDQLTKTRYIGGWSSNRCGVYLERCRQQLKVSGALQPKAAVDEFPEEVFAAGPDLLCEHCGSERVELIGETPKPSWKELFWREDARCPRWYADRQQESHRRFWTGCYGEDFYD